MKEKTYTTSRIYAVPWILLFIFIILFLLVNGIGKTFARQALDDLIAQKLPAHYNLSYDQLEFSLFEKELTIKDLVFTPDSSIQQTGVDRSYQVTIPHFSIRLKSLEAILFRQELIIDGITIIDPQFSVLSFSNGKTLTASTESLSLFELVRQYLNLFRVKSFDVQNAGLQYRKDTENKGGDFSLKAFDFRVHEFALDSNLTRQNFLNAESVELIINKQQFYLSDNIHRFSFDQFRLSTRDSILSFSNVLLEPRDSQTAKTWSPASGPALYKVYIPQVDLSGIDYYQSYLNKDLRIEKVVLEEPDISVIGGERRLREASMPDQSAILDVLSQLAPSMQLGHIQLNKANVRLDFQQTRNRDLHFLIDHINLYQCYIDPSNFTYSKEFPPFQDFNFQITNFRESLPDGLHVLNVRQISIPSMLSGVELKGLSILPYNEKRHPTKTKVIQRFPYLAINGIDYLGLLQQAPLEIGNLYLKNPETKIISSLENERDTIRQEVKIARIKSSITGSFLQEISADKLHVEAGKWQLDDWMKVDQYDFKAYKFRLNEQTESWKSLADTFTLDIAGMEVMNDSFQLRLEQFSTNGINHDFQKIRLLHQTDYDSMAFQLDRFQVFHTDLDQLVNQEFECDSLLMNDLTADIKLKKSRGGEGMNIWRTHLPFSTPYVNLDNVELHLETSEGDQLRFDHFGAILSADSLLELKDLQVFDLQFRPAKGNHYFQLKALEKTGWSDSYRLTDLEVIPSDSLLYLEYPIRIPAIMIRNWDRDRYFEKKEWSFQKISLEKAQFHVLLRQLDTLRNLPDQENEWPLVLMDSLELKDAQFQFMQKDSVELSFPNFDLNVQGINTKKQRVAAAAWTDLYRSFQLRGLKGMHLTLPGSAIRVGSFTVDDKGQSNWMVKDIYLNTEEDPVKQETFLDKLTIHQLSLDQWVKKRNLVMDSLLFGQINTTLYQQKKRDSLQVQVKNKAPILPLPFNAMDIGLLGIREAYLDLHMDTPLTLDRIRVLASGIKTDSVLDVSKLEQYYQNLDLDMDNIYYVLGKYEEYQLSQSLEYNSTKKRLLLTDVAIESFYDKKHFSRIIPHQEDLFDIKVDSVIVDGFEVGKLFDPLLHWPKVQLKQLSLDVFRDQNPVHPNNPQDLIQEQMKQIPVPFLLDTLDIQTDIHFAILPESATEEGQISFDDLHGRLLHLTNQDSLWDQPMRLEAQGKLYGSTDLEAQMSFDLADPMNGFTMSGRIGRMDLQVMNKILRPTARIFIRKGRSKEITFEISANKDVAIGDMFFRYNKLKFRIVDKDDIHHVSLGNSLLSFWANRLVKSNNPSFLRKRKGVIYFERNPNRAIFHYWSRALLSGVVSSVGVKNNKKQLKKLGYENLEALNYQELFGDKEKNE